jgi:hypothetical protein
LNPEDEVSLSHPVAPEEIFRLHPKIRWTAFSTQEEKVTFSEMRPGVTSYTSEREDRSFMEFGPQVMGGIAERLSITGGAGKLESLIVNLEKDSVLLTPVRNGYLAISVNRTDSLDVFKEIEPKIRRLWPHSSSAVESTD